MFGRWDEGLASNKCFIQRLAAALSRLWLCIHGKAFSQWKARIAIAAKALTSQVSSQWKVRIAIVRSYFPSRDCKLCICLADKK